MKALTLRTLGLGGALTLAYLLAARLGFSVAVVAEQVTTVWLPTGIAQAALLLLGIRFWPAVWLGALLANAGTAAPLWTAAAIATGNTLEAVVAAFVLLRLTRFDPGLRRTRDNLLFILVAAGLSPVISATVGVAALCAAGVQPWDRFGLLWSGWWLGDAAGALVIGPVLLTVFRRVSVWDWRRGAETAALVAGTVVAMHLVFREGNGGAGHHSFAYVIFPFLVTAAIRQRQPATSLVVLAAAAVGTWNTARGTGPFAAEGLHDSLVLLQVFMGLVACTGLLLAAAIGERLTSERRRAAGQAVSEVLAAEPSLESAAAALVRGACENLAWATGALWLVDPHANRLRCLAVWPPASSSQFAAATSSREFAPGAGLPGRVWATGEPIWLPSVADATDFPRRPAAKADGLVSGFAFPIRSGHEVSGVLEFFSRSYEAIDPDLLGAMSTVGNQVGQFIARKRVEMAAGDQQRRVEAILETALDAIIGMDHTGVITDFNPAAERTFGYTSQEAVGRELADLIIPAELRDAHRAGLRHFLRTGEGPFIGRRIETSACHAEGHLFPVEVAITRVDQEPPRFTGFVRDLSARVRAEQEREQLLARELEARREAESANRAKDEFLATLSHELRTPLNAILGWTRMLMDGALDEQQRRRALEVIDRNANLQAQLVADILDVSSIITGGLKLNQSDVDVQAVIGASLDMLRPAAEAKGLTLAWRPATVAPLVRGDAQRLQQVVWNLVANAIKFTPAGGRVAVDLTETPATLRISVRDNGAGIDPAFLPHVFERFRQGEPSIGRQHGGLGLGLAIVRHLVELHGGRVEAQSEGLNRGATFMVELPRIPATAD